MHLLEGLTLESGMNIHPWINVAPGTYAKTINIAAWISRQFDFFINSQKGKKEKNICTSKNWKIQKLINIAPEKKPKN